MTNNKSSELIVRDIKRKTRKKYSSEEKIQIVLEGLRGQDSIAAICRREGIPIFIIAGVKTFLRQAKSVFREIPFERQTALR